MVQLTKLRYHAMMVVNAILFEDESLEPKSMGGALLNPHYPFFDAPMIEKVVTIKGSDSLILDSYPSPLDRNQTRDRNHLSAEDDKTLEETCNTQIAR